MKKFNPPEEIEAVIEKKYRAREHKKRQRQKVSGRSVLTLKTIILKKARRN